MLLAGVGERENSTRVGMSVMARANPSKEYLNACMAPSYVMRGRGDAHELFAKSSHQLTTYAFETERRSYS